MSATLKFIAAKFFPMINLAPRNLRQSKEEDKSLFTDKCIEFLDWHGPGVRLSEEEDDGLFWSYDHSEKKDIKYAIHNVMAAGEERTKANIAHFAATEGTFLKTPPSLLMPTPFLAKAKKSKE